MEKVVHETIFKFIEVTRCISHGCTEVGGSEWQFILVTLENNVIAYKDYGMIFGVKRRSQYLLQFVSSEVL